jgi:hypothetical protein
MKVLIVLTGFRQQNNTNYWDYAAKTIVKHKTILRGSYS